VWAGWVSTPEAYFDRFRKVRSSGYALHMHLALMSPVTGPKEAKADVDNWNDAAERILALESTHFRLSSAVRSDLRECPYPNPQRMLNHVIALERLAKAYADGSGNLGGSISKVAIEKHGIEIALFDSGLPATRQVDGLEVDTRPHVKVDDFKIPDECGRIYFAMVNGEYFFVDHIGLHDYVKTRATIPRHLRVLLVPAASLNSVSAGGSDQRSAHRVGPRSTLGRTHGCPPPSARVSVISLASAKCISSFVAAGEPCQPPGCRER
jgi:hypothetical protein